jgi:dethiobiotin synthetase
MTGAHDGSGRRPGVRRPGCFVTGTDTGVGKTVVAAAIVARLAAGAIPVTAVKPLITGLREPADPDWPHDHELLARAAGCTPAEVMVAGYGPPVSPHLAAELAGEPLPSIEWLTGAVAARTPPGSVLVVEGVGGLLVPLGPDQDVRALAAAFGLPLVIAARPGLGTINHTLLTLEAARAAGLAVAGVVLTPWPADPDAIAESNRETIAQRGAVEVATLALLPRADPDLLAAAATGLPLARWLGLGGSAASARPGQSS